MRPIDADKLKEYACVVDEICYYGGGSEFLAVSVENIDDMPTLDVMPVIHAHWIPTCNTWTHDPSEYGSAVYVCSKCQRYSLCEEPYCHCGAKMDEVI